MEFDAHLLDLRLALGKTFSQPVAFTNGQLVYREIQGVTMGAPTRLLSTSHGLPNGWPFLIETAEPAGLNRKEAYSATVIDDDTVDINDLNTRNWDAYTENSGVIVYSSPADPTGYTGSLSCRATRESSDVLFTLGASNILIDSANKRVNIQMTAAETAALIPVLAGVTTAVYDLELATGAGVVDLWTHGDIAILRDL